MNGWWAQQLKRADELAAQSTGSKELLVFYGHLLRAQRDVYQFLCGSDWPPVGDLEQDLPALRNAIPAFLKVVESRGPLGLASEALALSKSSPSAVDGMLNDYWRCSSDLQFFAKAFLQPYARWLAERECSPQRRDLPVREHSCPYCGGNPQVSFLQSREVNSESGNRDLICATCLSTWSFRRVVCANCGEERPAKLGYFHSPEFDHVRIEACDTCKHYIKGIDLTRLGFAVPLVAEIAAAPLDLWAREQGYTKIELNLVGL